jgi:transketolase
MAEAHLAARYNRAELSIIDHHTYVLASDGDLMEGVASEAASLAGRLCLGKLIVLYDDNRITLSASTDLTFTEDRAARFDAYGWHTQSVENGDDLEAIDGALLAARAEAARPSLILVRTHLGDGSPHKHDTFEAHGSPLGVEEVRLTKQNLGWPLEPDFYVPAEAAARFREALVRGRAAQAEWDERMRSYGRQYPTESEEMRVLLTTGASPGWEQQVPSFPLDPKGMSTRVASGKVMNALAERILGLVGGSADLDPSTFTALTDRGDFGRPDTPPLDPQGESGGGWGYAGRNVHFGVREHGMAGILNGLAAHGGLIPFGATFLIFSDYMRPPMRLAALQRLGVVYVFTHDSIGLGEDGPTHQPVEQLANLRAVPGLVVIRPGDANEVAVAWQVAVERRGGPLALVLSRQNLPVLDRETLAGAGGLRRGAYVLAEAARSPADLLLIASGSEVALVLAARDQLEARGISARVVSMPSWELFNEQSPEYRESVLPGALSARLVVEAAASQGWERYLGCMGEAMGIERFGASAPGPTVMKEYGFTTEMVVERALGVLARSRS